ncbi:DUF6683 family protein [Archangium lansingense]|uniref:TetR family transcriptional regulator n=1 Tax=Archangium lansingense TaxID=2995310 RepID=A0ABT4AI44_9BACT|nr:DUF6683 family protein [Archangium lansinium]MCY1081320.1 hypothetical protein [Archangium lansinium]
MNSFLRTIPVVMTGFLLLGAAGPEGARTFSPYRRYNSNAFVHGNFKPFFQRQWKPTPNPPPGDGSSVPPLLLPLSVSSFRMDGRSPIMPKRIAEGARDLESEHRKALEDALVQLLHGYEHLLEQQDASQLKHNLAGAFNHLFMSSYYALRDGQELNGAQQRSMLAQLNAAIAMGLKERRLSDRDKQELYESVVLSGSIILGLYNEGRDTGRPEQQKQARELAKELLEQMMGLRIEKVCLEDTEVRICD